MAAGWIRAEEALPAVQGAHETASCELSNGDQCAGAVLALLRA